MSVSLPFQVVYELTQSPNHGQNMGQGQFFLSGVKLV